jgi:hypothetical protein
MSLDYRTRLQREMEFCAQLPEDYFNEEDSSIEYDTSTVYEDEFESVSEAELAAGIPSDEKNGIYQSVNVWSEEDNEGSAFPNELEQIAENALEEALHMTTCPALLDAEVELTIDDELACYESLSDSDNSLSCVDESAPEVEAQYDIDELFVYSSSDEDEACSYDYPPETEEERALFVPETPPPSPSSGRVSSFSTRSPLLASRMFSSPILPLFSNKRKCIDTSSVCRDLRPLFKRAASL